MNNVDSEEQFRRTYSEIRAIVTSFGSRKISKEAIVRVNNALVEAGLTMPPLVVLAIEILVSRESE